MENIASNLEALGSTGQKFENAVAEIRRNLRSNDGSTFERGVEELGGFIFAYLGPQPAPLLPRYDVLAWEGYKDGWSVMLPCNWLQIMENTLDPVHVEWLHQNFADFIAQQLEAPEKRVSRTPHVKIGFNEFEYGIMKRRVVEGGSEGRDKSSHRFLFIFFF